MNNDFYKEIIIGHLLDQGYATFAKRFRDFKFIITEMYGGAYCGTAFMVPNDNVICINPGFFDLKDPDNPKEQKLQLDRISVLIRHELLHFLLMHENRFLDYLKNKYPNSWGRIYANPTMHRIANFAMDYDICNEAYEPEDKKVIKELVVNGKYVGGLITEEQVKNNKTSIWFEDGTKEEFSGAQFSGWEDKPMEEMWQMLHDAHEAYVNKLPKQPELPTPPAPPQPQPKKPDDPEYKAMFDKIIAKFGNGKVSKDEIKELYGRIYAGEDIDIDKWTFKA